MELSSVCKSSSETKQLQKNYRADPDQHPSPEPELDPPPPSTEETLHQCEEDSRMLRRPDGPKRREETEDGRAAAGGFMVNGLNHVRFETGVQEEPFTLSHINPPSAVTLSLPSPHKPAFFLPLPPTQLQKQIFTLSRWRPTSCFEIRLIMLLRVMLI